MRNDHASCSPSTRCDVATRAHRRAPNDRAGARLRPGMAAMTLMASVHAHATIINGSFEAGLAGWTAVGDVATASAAFGSGPAAGVQQAVLTNALDGDDASSLNVSGVAPELAGGALEAAIGLAVGDLDALTGAFDVAFEGSALRQSFTASAGQTLRFDWNFLTGDNVAADFAFVAIDGSVMLLADSLTATLVASGTPYAWETGYAAFSHQFALDGVHTLILGVVDSNDSAASSALLVDAVTLVPEPELPAMLALGLLSLVAARRRIGR